MKKILWLASYPKSGNTWLRSIVSTLLYTNNGYFNFKLLKLIEQYEKKIHFEFLKKNKKNDFKKIINKIEFLSKYWIKSQENIVYSNNIKPIFNIYKTHSANMAINKNPFTSSDLTAGCIYIIRDPREILISFAHHRGANLNDTIEFMSDIGAYFPTSDKNLLTYISRWDIHYKSWKKLNTPLLILKYEDLLNNTAMEIEKISAFLSKTSKWRMACSARMQHCSFARSTPRMDTSVAFPAA